MSLHKGAQGDEVVELQRELNQLGFDLEEDGIFGTKTYHAIITVQTIFGYDVDGVAGPATRKLIRKQAEYGWNLVAARKAFVNDPNQS
jgi:peptidoglycan hydrolase-like protein with peptidoglycan-binding domain